MTVVEGLASLAREGERRVANPAVAAVLRSPAHPLLSGRLLLLSYVGRRSGRRYTTPAMYRDRPDGVDLFTPADATAWWRNFRGGHPADVLVRGAWRAGRGEVVPGEAAVAEHLRWMVGPLWPVAGALDRADALEARLRGFAPRAVLVRVTFDEPAAEG